MKNLKFSIYYPNYYCISNTHIFIDFNEDNLKYLNELNQNSIKKIHVFITSHLGLNNTLKTMIDRFGTIYKKSNNRRLIRITVHIPRKLENLKSLAKKFLEKQEGNYLLIVESNGTIFSIKNKIKLYDSEGIFHKFREHFLSINFTETSIKIEILDSLKYLAAMNIKFIEWPYLISTKKEDSIFTNDAMRFEPEKFKDKLIQAFKDQCPPKIVDSFDNDEDIWNYITLQGEWSIKKE